MNALVTQPVYVASMDRRAAEGFFRVDLKRNDSPRNGVRVIDSDFQLRGMEGTGRTLYVLPQGFREATLRAILIVAKAQRFEVKFV